MKSLRWSQIGIVVLSVWVFGQSVAQQASNSPVALDTVKIEQLTGIKGKLDAAESVFKVSQPRADLNAIVAGVKMTPSMGLTSWAGFQAVGDQVMVMGDIVLQEDQINPVMSTALENGIEVTALHNHFLWDTPRIMFMHIGGMGNLETLAAGVGKVFAKVQETHSGKKPAAAIKLDAAKTSLDPKPIEAIIGAPVEKTGEVYKVTLGRTTQMNDHSAGKAMGVNTWAVFAGSDEKAIVEGDFAMIESELQGVLKALRGAGINIAAIHHHMVNETPKIVFLHYWGAGSVSDLAKGIKAALDTQAKS
ncbi:LppY/LpqO family protein [Methylobacter tundripaludum]|uniref:LppY/LpqO family protein n=1 Tax=Methylobacter tundripaludum TaxID=173365 RepID=UPI000487A18F|nr:LppY/LpqO family protein [Methylobacter tundripaludum]